MGSHFQIDVDELHMFANYEWWDFTKRYEGECNHQRMRSVIGWGPDVAHYELIQCDECMSRAWEDGRWTQERERHTGNHKFWQDRMKWFVKP